MDVRILSMQLFAHRQDMVPSRSMKCFPSSIRLASSTLVHGVKVQNSILATSKQEPSEWSLDRDGLLNVIHGELVPCCKFLPKERPNPHSVILTYDRSSLTTLSSSGIPPPTAIRPSLQSCTELLLPAKRKTSTLLRLFVLEEEEELLLFFLGPDNLQRKLSGVPKYFHATCHGRDVNAPKTSPSNVSTATTVYEDSFVLCNTVFKLAPSRTMEYFNQKNSPCLLYGKNRCMLSMISFVRTCGRVVSSFVDVPNTR
mmetsp:Transcript_23588/g.55868  ORF Transcript_23588/g.55868 Transcript_23588/m.55868 type:complete len:256 (-) Transcript_23588:1350-2117(-)